MNGKTCPTHLKQAPREKAKQHNWKVFLFHLACPSVKTLLVTWTYSTFAPTVATPAAREREELFNTFTVSNCWKSSTESKLFLGDDVRLPAQGRVGLCLNSTSLDTGKEPPSANLECNRLSLWRKTSFRLIFTFHPLLVDLLHRGGDFVTSNFTHRER